ncbi:hypothetical protein NQZ68_007120 [Dissostichus eleginoides]|nr:hypothetical protein NQZ68_007120 [Dissostichus eleginoides]
MRCQNIQETNGSGTWPLHSGPAEVNTAPVGCPQQVNPPVNGLPPEHKASIQLGPPTVSRGPGSSAQGGYCFCHCQASVTKVDGGVMGKAGEEVGVRGVGGEGGGDLDALYYHI